MPFTTYYGTASNAFQGVSLPDTTPVASGAQALYNSFEWMADYAASRVPFWDNTTAFVTGDQVCYDNFYWGAVSASTGVTPGTDATKWVKLGTGSGGGSISTISYYRTDTTVTSTPAAGKITWNNATQASATHLYANSVDDEGTDYYAFYSLIAVGDSILIQDRSDSANFQLWEVTATPSYASSVFDFTVSLTNSSGTGTTNFPNNHQVFFFSQRAAIEQPANQIVFGTGTGVSSSSNLIYDSANHRLTQTATISTTTAAQRLNATFNNGAVDMAARVSDTTLTAYGANSMLDKWQVNGTTIIAQIRHDGALSFGVNSALAWGNGAGGMLAMATPSTEPSTSPTTGNMVLWLKSSTNRIRTINGTGNTVNDVAYLSDLTALGLSSLAVSTTQSLNPAGKYIDATASSTITLTLTAGTTDSDYAVIEKVDSGAGFVNVVAGTGTISLCQQYDLITLRYNASTSKWVIESKNIKPLRYLYTATGTDTSKSAPYGITTAKLIAAGAGGGGASGTIRIASGNATGGGGGAGGGVTLATFGSGSIAGGTTITAVVGTGGTGGTAATGTTAQNGNAGNAGGNSTITIGSATVIGYGGNGAAQPLVASGVGAGGVAFDRNDQPGSTGATGGTGSTSAVATDVWVRSGGAGGGGGGGATSSATLASSAGGIGMPGTLAVTGGTAGTAGANGGNGSNGSDIALEQLPLGSGGGGGAGLFGGSGLTAGSGGNGGRAAGGGGGGANRPASATSCSSGAGGNGGDGCAAVVFYF